METVIKSLTAQLQKEIEKSVHENQRQELLALSLRLLDLFSHYDRLDKLQKSSRITEANKCISDIKASLSALDSPEPQSKGDISGDRKVLSRLSSVRAVQGIGPRIADLLSQRKILTIEDLLYFLPRTYQDRREVQRISNTVPDVIQTVVGRITLAEMRFFGRRKVFEVTIEDGHGTLKSKWFKGREAYLRGTFSPGKRLIVTGKVTGFPFERVMIHPDYEFIDEHDDQLLHFNRIVPVYPEIAGVAQKTFRRIMWQAVRDYGDAISSPIPYGIVDKRNLPDIRQAFRQVHFPSDQDMAPYLQATSEAHRRLIYDELFFFQLGLAMKKENRHLEQAIAFRNAEEKLQRFFSLLPFDLTAAQRRVITEIERDMSSARRMHRLLQGDVGSGKTLVSMAAMIIACGSGYQAAMMAPTEILAEQHYQTLKRWSDLLGLRIGLITGQVATEERRAASAKLKEGEIDIAVGTHALFQQGVVFAKLGLVVIDEQHRFGVLQRGKLLNKGIAADCLVMTATPIPRTLAMTVYGDLDISLIDEMPLNRIAIRTKVFFERQRKHLYEIISKEVEKNHQVFMVYPLVEASEHLDLKDSIRMAKHLQNEIFPDYRIDLIHGRMNRREKEKVMADFASGHIHILVATTLIEVGIDIPLASLIVIEHAERFGLSQLHQLRGRVGRGKIPSACVLMTHSKASEKSSQRLKIMEETSDGFRIAEEDLSIRGPGELLGIRQSGLPDFRVADIRRDSCLLSEARQDAFLLVQGDPHLGKPENQGLREETYRRWAKGMALTEADGSMKSFDKS